MDLPVEQYGPQASEAQSLLERLAHIDTTQAKAISVLWCSMPPREVEPAKRALKRAAEAAGRSLIDDRLIGILIERAREQHRTSGRAIWIAAGMAAQDASNAVLMSDALDADAVAILTRSWQEGLNNLTHHW